VERQLSQSDLAFELNRAEVADGRAPAEGIVEPLNVVEHVGSGVVACPVDFSSDPFGLERGEEALDGGVVLDVPGTAHGADDAIVGHQALERLARILAAAIGMVQQGAQLAASRDRHDERIGDKLSWSFPLSSTSRRHGGGTGR
jgi:hypothetical protein